MEVRRGWGGGGGGRGAWGAAWGLLGPTEGIVICNIHSNVPYQMQRVRRCSGMEISLVLHSALVTARANSDKWINSDYTSGTLEIQGDVWMAEIGHTVCGEVQHALTLLSHGTTLSILFLHAASGWLSHFIWAICTFLKLFTILNCCSCMLL